MDSNTAHIGIGRCPDHGIVTENDGATIRFPTTAECYCGRDLESATVAGAEEVRAHA